MTASENEDIKHYTHFKIVSPVVKYIVFNMGCFLCLA